MIKSTATRSALLLSGGALAVALSLLNGCQPVTQSRTGAQTLTQTLPAPSGNAELDELRRLAIAAPIEELVAHWLDFGDVFATSYRHDVYLPTGIERLVDHVIKTPEVDQRHMLARVLAQIIQLGEPSLQQRLGHRLPQLQLLR